MVGNLLDNACKWAKGNVSVSAERAKDADMINIFVDDDGPGLTEADRAKVVKRGQRLDETKPGSGLGLSIVADLAISIKAVAALGRLRRGWPQAPA